MLYFFSIDFLLRFCKRLCWLVSLSLLVLPVLGLAAEVNIYSARKEALIKPILDQFGQAHDVKINLVTGKPAPLIKRMESEGHNSPVDLFFSSDVVYLYRATKLGLAQPVHSEILNVAIPAQYRDENGYWFGLSLRARALVYAPPRVSQTELSDYLSLAEPYWRDRLCVRSSTNVYNQSLVAAMIVHYGVERTQQWVGGLVANFARPPRGGDRDQIRAVASGQCNIAIVNSYYLAGMLDSGVNQEVEIARSVRLFFPNQGEATLHRGAGLHVNISGVLLSRYAKNADIAVRLLEYLVSDQAQKWYAEQNHEYPIKAGIEHSRILTEWGDFIADPTPLEELARLNHQAVLLMDKAGWR